jgi:phospholipid/cholesterol/gamma-HCH transport system substrate-binding protein
MSNKVRIYINLVVFLGVFVVMIGWALQNVVSLDRVERPYDLVVEADAASGVRANAEVAYLGVHYGRVDRVELVEGGVRLHLKIDRGREIPEGSTPRIFRKSPIGEPYIDFQPPDGFVPDGAEHFADDDLVPIRASVPLEFSELLRTASELIGNIDPAQAGNVLDELATALEGRGEDLNRLTVATDQLAGTFAARTDALDRLAENNTRLTAVLADNRGALGATITDLSLLAESLRAASGDTAVLLDRGTALLATTADLLADARPSIDCLFDNLVPVMDITSTDARLDGLVRTLQDAPGAFALFATTIDEEPDGPWARVNLEVDLTSPPVQYEPPLSLPAVQPLVACPGVVAAGTGTAIPSTPFRPGDVLPTSGSPASLPATGAAAAGAIAAVLVLGAVALRHLSRAADGGA